jgi:hypothetical protein
MGFCLRVSDVEAGTDRVCTMTFSPGDLVRPVGYGTKFDDWLVVITGPLNKLGLHPCQRLSKNGRVIGGRPQMHIAARQCAAVDPLTRLAILGIKRRKGIKLSDGSTF